MEIPKEVEEVAFQFAAKVAPIYKILKWNWYDEISFIPSAMDILKQSISLYQQLMEKKCGVIGTGGIEVSDDEGLIKFSFSNKKNQNFNPKSSK